MLRLAREGYGQDGLARALTLASSDAGMQLNQDKMRPYTSFSCSMLDLTAHHTFSAPGQLLVPNSYRTHSPHEVIRLLNARMGIDKSDNEN